MSSVLTIAREDARRAFRSRLVWGTVILLGVMFLPSTGASASPRIHPIEEYLLVVPFDLLTFSLVVVAAVGYGAVVNERIAGTVRFVLGLPATRRDLILGKLLSRVGIVVAALTVILVIANGLVFRGYGRFYLLPFWVMGAWILGYGVVWCTVIIGYSAAFDSPYRTLGAFVVTYVFFFPGSNLGVWNVAVRPLFALLFTGSLDPPTYETLATAPLWVHITERLNPLIDFWYAMRWSIDFVGPGTPTGGPLPHVVGTVIFLSFGVLPLVFGLRRLEHSELGAEQSGFRLGDWLWRSLGQVSRSLTERTAIRSARTRANPILQLAIADLRHAFQNWIVTGALVVTLLLAGPSLWGSIKPSSVHSVTRVLIGIPYTFTLPVLVLGIAVGHNAVVGERTAGTVRLVLGMPITRRHLLFGKLVSRIGIVVITLLPLFLLAEGLVVTRFGRLYLGAFLAWGGGTLLFALIWTVVTVSISAAVSTRYRSLAVIGAIYLLFSRRIGLWEPLVRPVIAFISTGQVQTHGLSNVSVQTGNFPIWFYYFDNTNPFIALETIREGFFEITGYGTQFTNLTVPLFIYSLVVVFLFATAILVTGVRRLDRSDLG